MLYCMCLLQALYAVLYVPTKGTVCTVLYVPTTGTVCCTVCAYYRHRMLQPRQGLKPRRRAAAALRTCRLGGPRAGPEMSRGDTICGASVGLLCACIRRRSKAGVHGRLALIMRTICGASADTRRVCVR
jgi:hypothetical protein